MKRRRIMPRTDIPDWRDPDMPCVRTSRDGKSVVEVPNWFINKISADTLEMGDEPIWSDDETYSMRREKK